MYDGYRVEEERQEGLTVSINYKVGINMDKYLFCHEINNWDSWGKVYCSIEAFTPLVREIFRSEGLVFQPLSGCKPGTNAVFRAGDYIAKVFVPYDSGYDSLPDYKAELYAMERANMLGVSVPRVIAGGLIQDKYLFRYLIMEYVPGRTLGDRKPALSNAEKTDIGKKLRSIVNGWATDCGNFNGVDVISRTLDSKRWADAPSMLREEQKRYLQTLKKEQFVYVHGDLTEDNLIIDDAGRLYVIDFADSLYAPASYEDMAVICDAFRFDPWFLKGYFGDMGSEEITERCIKGILCHEYGYQVVKNIVGPVNDLDELRNRISALMSYPS